MLASIALTALGCAPVPSAPGRKATPSVSSGAESTSPAAESAKLRGELEPSRPLVLATLGAAKRAHRGSIWDGCLLGKDTFLTTGADSMVRVWDVPSGASRGTLPLGRSLSQLACARDGSRFAVAGDLTLELRDGATGTVQRAMRLEGVTRALAFSPNGRDLARVDDRCRTSVIAPSGEIRMLPQAAPLSADLGAIDWDASGEMIASSCGSFEVDHGIDLFAPGGAAPARHFDRPAPRRGHVGGLAFVDGALYFTTHELHVLDPEALSIRETAQMGSDRSSTLFFEASPDGKRLALWNRGRVEIRDTPGGEAVAALEAHVDEVRWVDDRHLAATSDHELRWFELGPGALTEQGAVPSLRGDVTALAISGDDRWLAAGDNAGQLIVFDLTSGSAPRRLRDDDAPVRELRFTAEGALLAVHGGTLLRFEPGTFSRTAAVAQSGTDVFEYNGAIGSIGQHQIFLAEKDGKVKSTERTGELAAISSDGAWFVEVDTQHHRAALVERATSKSKRTFDIGQGQAECLLSADHTLLACRGTSGYFWTRVFDTTTGKSLLALEGNSVDELLDLATSPRRLIVREKQRGLCAHPLDGSAAACIGEDVLPSVRAARVIQHKGAPALAVGGGAGVVEIVALD